MKARGCRQLLLFLLAPLALHATLRAQSVTFSLFPNVAEGPPPSLDTRQAKWIVPNDDGSQGTAIAGMPGGGFAYCGEVVSVSPQFSRRLWVVRLTRIGAVLYQESLSPPGVTETRAGVWESGIDSVGSGGAYVSACPLQSGAVWCLNLDAAGHVLWERGVVATVPNSLPKFSSVRTANDGGAFVACTYTLGDSLIVKLDQGGGLVWAKKISVGGGSAQPFLVGMSPTGDGGVYLGVWDDASFTSHVVRLDQAGNVVYANQYMGPDSQSWIESIVTTFGGGAAVGGRQSGSGVIFRLDPAGNVLWSRRPGNSRVRSCTVNSIGGLDLVGDVGVVGANTEPFVMRLAPDGSLVSQSRFSVTGAFNIWPNSMCRTGDGGVAWIGSGLGPASVKGAWFMRVGPDLAADLTCYISPGAGTSLTPTLISKAPSSVIVTSAVPTVTPLGMTSVATLSGPCQ